MKYKAKLNDVSIPQKTQWISITKTDFFMPYGEIKFLVKNIKKHKILCGKYAEL